MPALAVLLVFADDWVDDKRRLRSLLAEDKAISKAIGPLVDDGHAHLLHSIHNATVDDVIASFRARRFRDRIAIFHFGGHAGASALLFDDGAGRPANAPASALAEYLGRQRGLVLVFLNGCGTAQQVHLLRAAGVKAVVATTSAIQDTVAAEFAAAFYAELTSRSLRDAFDTAVRALRLSWHAGRAEIRRDLVQHDESATSTLPWILDCAPGFEAWTLGTRQASNSRRVSTRWLVAAAAAFIAVLAFIALAAGAKSLVCQTSWLRSLCTVPPAVPFVLVVPDEDAVMMMSPGKPSPFTVTVGGERVVLPAEGLLIGTIASVPDSFRDEYRLHVLQGHPVRHRLSLDADVAHSIHIAYRGHPCRRPDLGTSEQTIWLVKFTDCSH